MSQIVRIGDKTGRILSVTASAVEYADADGQMHTIDLEKCRFGEGKRCVGLRGLSDPPWFEFMDDRRRRFVFDSGVTLMQGLLLPLARVGWTTLDGN